MMAEVAAFDNLEGLARMGGDLAAFVRRAAIEEVAAHEAEKDIWQRVLAMGRQAFGQFLASQGDGDVGETIEMDDGKERLRHARRATYRVRAVRRSAGVAGERVFLCIAGLGGHALCRRGF